MFILAGATDIAEVSFECGAEFRQVQMAVDADGTLPVWLKNDGLHSVESTLTFEEIVQMLEAVAAWADAAQNPATIREKIAAKYGINVDEKE